VSSHPPNDFFPFVWWSRRKIFFNTWHGFGLKGIFFADSGDTDHNRKSVLKLNQKTDFFLVSSKIESATMTKCFLIDPNKFLYIGQPRNDSLVKGSSENYLNRLFKTIPEYQKIILYAPTYRRNNSVKMFPFTDFEITKFKKFLEQEKMIFLVRGHYYSTTSEEKISDDRIFNLSHEVVEDVYDILSQVDILITDYSSIYTDFLLLDRPMIFLPYDLDDYERKRGLLLDDFDFWTPGSKPSNYDEFIQELTKLNKNTDEYSVKRKLIKKIFHPNQEGKSCEQLYEIIKKDIR